MNTTKFCCGSRTKSKWSSNERMGQRNWRQQVQSCEEVGCLRKQKNGTVASQEDRIRKLLFVLRYKKIFII